MNLLDALYISTAVLTAPWWARKTRGGWDERCGKIDALPAKTAGVPRVMLHAVSVGEVNALRSLVPMLTEQGEVEVVVSVTTDTGIARARQLWSNATSPQPIHVVRYPLDFSRAVARFLDAVRPDAVGLVELELWPNFIGACRRRGIPVGVINGRLSARSFQNYAKFRRVLKRMFSSLSFAAVQDEDYAARFLHMGVAADKVVITGSMKWDAVTLVDNADGISRARERAETLARELGIDRNRPLVVAGSTGPLPETSKHAGEESLIDAALRSAQVDAQLLCAPRKPERFEEAFQSLGGEQQCVRRSHATTSRERETPVLPVTAQRFLLDTIGELSAAYELADLVIIGRSFGDLHGSDPIEPIALGKPVIIGPRFGDFQSVVETFRKAGGIVVLPDVREETLAHAIHELLDSPQRRSELAARGIQCVRANQGATRRHAELLRSLFTTTSQSHGRVNVR